MAEVTINTEQLREMVDKSSKKAADESVKSQVAVMKMVDKREWDKFMKSQTVMNEDISEIKKLLIGDEEYGTTGVLTRFNEAEKITEKIKEHDIINRVRKMWDSYSIAKWAFGFLGVTNLVGIVALVVMFREVF